MTRMKFSLKTTAAMVAITITSLGLILVLLECVYHTQGLSWALWIFKGVVEILLQIILYILEIFQKLFFSAIGIEDPFDY